MSLRVFHFKKAGGADAQIVFQFSNGLSFQFYIDPPGSAKEYDTR